MKIGNIEIRIVRPQVAALISIKPLLSEAEVLRALAVPTDESWFVAVNQVIDEAERLMITQSRALVNQSNECINAVGGGASLEMLRAKLEALRSEACRGKE